VEGKGGTSQNKRRSGGKKANKRWGKEPDRKGEIECDAEGEVRGRAWTKKDRR
jgi:hypothetical protein